MFCVKRGLHAKRTAYNKVSINWIYDITWQVIDGDKTDYLSWVKIGLANSSVDELTPLTDTISDLQYTSDGGSYAKVVFRHRYYAPDVAAANGGESSVHFAFSVHQSQKETFFSASVFSVT